ncbi:MAG TPA: CPBP family intramembrane metalloprotease, partial [Candidatus Atopostipes pullistercoris]|nr:CPBP family intramembrane metalloprotease [Candidatus Atopostipes pullistercoris]
FFRYIIYYYFSDNGSLTVVFLSNFLFILSHIISNPNVYSKFDILRQIFFSTLCCYTLLQTNNIIYAISIHLMYNLPFILVLIKRAIFNKDNIGSKYQ